MTTLLQVTVGSGGFGEWEGMGNNRVDLAVQTAAAGESIDGSRNIFILLLILLTTLLTEKLFQLLDEFLTAR